MYYPQFDLPTIGGGSLIAIVSIVHVFVAHFAVGAGIFNAVTETIARRRNDDLLLGFLRYSSKFLILIPFIFGAVTGVGIWFCIAIVAPRATSLLIHNFVWGWATEWVFFFVEIAAGYVYYYTWDRLTPRRHLIVGWIYAVASWMSLFIINGIITFMLTPGRWQTLRAEQNWNAAFWAAIFNPTYWPSLVLRTISALALAGIFVCIMVNISRAYTREQAIRIIRVAAFFMLPLILMVPTALWYFYSVPAAPRELPFGGAAAMSLFFLFGFACSVLITLYALAIIRSRSFVSLASALMLAAMAFIATGSMEFVREGIRKPYVIRGYLWSNGIANQPAEFAKLNADGILPHSPWIATPEQIARADARTNGRWVFQAECSQCHTVSGVNGVAPLVEGWSREMLRFNVDHLHRLKGFMPPFIGTTEEKDALAEFLFQLNPIHRDESPAILANANPSAEARQ